MNRGRECAPVMSCRPTPLREIEVAGISPPPTPPMPIPWAATALPPVFRSTSLRYSPRRQNRRERNAMQIVDAQIHTWGTGLPSNLSHWQITHFTPEEAIALMDEGGVDAAVIHPPGWDPNSTAMALQAVQNYPD